MKITVELPEEWVELLRVLGDPAEVLAELADHAQQGVFRPGSWERGWVAQAFGDEWTDKLEVDPDAHWRQRPKK
jgi:hypothetical protein